jgi:hypothetical protein
MLSQQHARLLLMRLLVLGRSAVKCSVLHLPTALDSMMRTIERLVAYCHLAHVCAAIVAHGNRAVGLPAFTQATAEAVEQAALKQNTSDPSVRHAPAIVLLQCRTAQRKDIEELAE